MLRDLVPSSGTIRNLGGGSTDFSTLSDAKEVYDSTGLVTMPSGTTVRQVVWTPDGSSFTYTSDGTTDGMWKVPCTTPFEPDSGTLSTTPNQTPPATWQRLQLWNEDGTKGFYANASSYNCSCDMSTPYDVDSATYNSDVMWTSDLRYISGMHWNADGSKVLCYRNYLTSYLGTFNLATPYVITSGDMTGTNIDQGPINLSGLSGYPGGLMLDFVINDDGTQGIGCHSTTVGRLYYFTFSTPYDITTIAYTGTIDLTGPGQVFYAMSLAGGRLVCMEGTTRKFYIYDLR